MYPTPLRNTSNEGDATIREHELEKYLALTHILQTGTETDLRWVLTSE